jgi:hypothetical protein
MLPQGPTKPRLESQWVTTVAAAGAIAPFAAKPVTAKPIATTRRPAPPVDPPLAITVSPLLLTTGG